MSKEKTEHKQVWITDCNGRDIHVDKGLRHFLNFCADLKIKTEYSCQGSDIDHQAAYVVVTFRTFWPIFKLVMKLYFLRRLPESFHNLIKAFRQGHKEFRWSAFKQMPDALHEIGRYEWTTGNFYSVCHSTEVTYSQLNGFRVTLRWPREETYTFICLLDRLLIEVEKTSQK